MSQKNFFFDFYFLCNEFNCLYVYVTRVSSALGDQKKVSDPWNWGYRDCEKPLGCWDPSPGPLLSPPLPHHVTINVPILGEEAKPRR